MSGRLMKYICVFFVLLFMQSVAFAEPEWFGNTSSIPSIYDGTTVAEFNISLNDTGTDYAIDTVFIELNWTGTPTNYTMTNDTYGGYIYNYTNVIGANNNNSQYWKVFFNNTTDSWNTSDTWQFTIGKASVPLVLENNNSWNGTYLNPTNTTGSGCPAQLTDCNLYRNDTGLIGSGSPISDEVSLPIGTYEYVYNTSGNRNYTNNSISNILVIGKAPTSISLWLNDTEGSNSYDVNDIANFTAMINVTGLTINITSNYTGFGQLNGTTSIENATNLTEEGLFYINASSEGNESFSSTSTLYYFDTIAPQYGIITPPINSTDVYGGINDTYWFNISLIAATIDHVWFGFANSTSNFSLYNSTDIQNSSGIYSINITDLPVEDYTYFWCANNTVNKTNCTGNITFNVTKDSGYIMWYIDPSLSVTYGTATNITCSKDKGDPSSIIRLYRGGSLLYTDTISVTDYNSALAEGTYVYNCTINESQNYTFYSYPQTLTISSAQFVPSGGGDTPTTSSGAFTITPSESSLTVGTGDSKEITFTLKNTRSSDITGITITVSGISSDWYSLDKTSIDKLRHDTGLDNVKMTLNIPEDADKATYSIRVKASGKEAGVTTTTIQTTVPLTVTDPSTEEEEEIVEAALTTNETAAPGNETEVSPTGFLNASSQYIPYVVPVLGAVASVLIFFKRDDITTNLMGLIGTTVPEKQIHKKHKKSKKHKKHHLKDFTYKLSINLRKEKKPKTLEIEEEKADKLEREINRDIKELKNIIETEKKIKKRRK